MTSQRFSKVCPSNLGLALVLACAGSAASAQTAPNALQAGLADYLEMPITGRGAGNTPFQIARVNFLIEEPGARRLFISDQIGTLYIVDKRTQRPVSYINFNGSAGAGGLFSRFAVDGSYASGLLGFTFDPQYRQNGTFYTIHLENPAVTDEAGEIYVLTKSDGMVRRVVSIQ